MDQGKESSEKSKPGMEDLLFGLFLVALSVFVYISTNRLSTGTAADMGPGYFPKAIAIAMFCFGGFFTIRSFFIPGEKVTLPFWRGFILIPAATGAFALLLNPAGLAIASFTAMVLVSLASKETRFIEVLIFSACISAGTVLLFVKALAMPAPIFPW